MKPYIPALIVILAVVAILIGWAIYYHAANTSAPVAVTTPVSVPATSTPSTGGSASSTALTSATLPLYTLADIAQHATAASCWLAIDGNVYDVTTFIPIHPGGKAILRGCGKDASALFHSVPAHAEANAEATVAPKYLIGTLATSTAPAAS